MSKFVTYPAVTVLDNDHALLIDDPNAGTNSITAENAGNTLLSKWSGFDTFDEAVQNTISNNQEFIDRDTAIRSETAELKRKIATTFPAKYASGQIATFESEFENAPLKSCIVQVDPVQDLHGYDSPWPAGGGVNTLDPESLIEQYPSPAYGLAIARSGEWLTINGTYSSEIQSPQFRFMKKKDDSTFDDAYWAFPDSNSSNNIPGWISKADSNKTLTIGLQNMIQGNTYNLRFRLMGVTDTTRPTDYAPYENICPISGFTGVEVQRTGKNLLNLVESEMVSSGWNRIFPISLKAGTYIISCQNQFGTSAKGAYVTLTDENDVTIIKALTNGYTFGDTVFVGAAATITEEEAKKIKNIRFALRASGATYNDVVQGNIQLELGSTATDYEPYQGNTYPITFPSEAGIVYGAYIDVLNGELVVDRAMVDLGTCNIKEYVDTGITNHLYSATLPDELPYYDNNVVPVHLKCSALKPIEIARPIGFLKTLEPNTVAIRITYTDRVYIMSEIETAEAMKQSLDGVQLVYPLATPIHYPLTPTEIKTLLGVNNVWANTGDTSVEYLMSDVGWYVEKKLRAFQSILAGVEDSAVASKNYSTNSYLIFNDDIYRVTKTITAGETIEDGVNVTKTTVAEQLMALAQV